MSPPKDPANDAHDIPLLSEPVSLPERTPPHRPLDESNPFLPHDTLKKLALERAQFMADLVSTEKTRPTPAPPPAEASGSTPAEPSCTRRDLADKNLRLVIEHAAHEVFLDFLPAIQEEILKRTRKELGRSPREDTRTTK